MDQLKLIEMQSPLRRALLIVPVALALLGSWYAGRWYVGNFVAEFAPAMEQGADVARSAIGLAPADPRPRWSLAEIEKGSLTAEGLQQAVRHYEEAASLSPNDFRLWLDLGRAREQAGDTQGARQALERSVALAPSYSRPHWQLGNLLLRQGRSDDAFKELQRAAAAETELRPQVLNLAWYVYGGDVERMKAAVGDSPGARADLALYMAGRARVDDALKLWSSLNAAEKKEQSAAGDALMRKLLEARHYRAVLEIERDLRQAKGASLPVLANVMNGDFKTDVGASGASLFDWQVRSVQQAQLAIDGRVGHGDARSLRISFNVPTNLVFNNVSQLVAVEPSKQYRLECYVRTQSLESAGTPVLEIVNTTDDKVIAASEPLATGTHDWQQITIDFKSPAEAEAVTVRIRRATCGADAVCPIYGIVWYDDFNLQPIG
jgi:tetratricopeptide (TPR) repeat protein